MQQERPWFPSGADSLHVKLGARADTGHVLAERTERPWKAASLHECVLHNYLPLLRLPPALPTHPPLSQPSEVIAFQIFAVAEFGSRIGPGGLPLRIGQRMQPTAGALQPPAGAASRRGLLASAWA